MKKLGILFGIIFSLPAFAETSFITVSGRVVDSNGEPLIGASVYVTDDQATGATTDLDGNFTINAVPDNKKLTVSYIGFKTTEKSVSADMGTIELQEDSNLLEGVVVTATECTVNQLTIAHAYSGELRNGECIPKDCFEGYKLNTTTNTCDEIICEEPRYILNAEKDGCEDQVGKTCTSTDKNASKAEYEWTGTDLVCKIKKCKKGYLPNDNGTACEVSSGPCTAEQLKNIPNATAGELKKGTCYATECEAGFDVSDGKCVEISGDCKPMPKNATAAHREYDKEAQKEICIIDKCKDGYTVADDKMTCIKPILSEEDSKKQIEELQKNADEMKAKEQSAANKLLGAASIGAMGIGGMQALSALSEQSADTAAEQDMTAYLATFRCDYGQGRNIRGGESNIVLPGGNELFPLYTEYIALASNLKTRKEALGMQPGIESEIIYDKATTGLYDDVSTGKVDGSFASIAAALTNPNSAAAVAWNEQQSATAQKLKTGAITAGVGALVGIAGNLAINENKKAAQESSDEINAKYEPLKSLENNVKGLPDKTAGQKCPSDATGTYPNCTCNDKSKIHNQNTNKCESCPQGKTPKDNSCVDPSVEAAVAAVAAQDWSQPQTVENMLNRLFSSSDNSNTANQNQQNKNEVSIPANRLFATNSYTLDADGKKIITDFAKEVLNDNKNKETYCITVTGHTDPTGNDTINKPLSENRAKAVSDVLISAGINKNNIKTFGKGSEDCTAEFRQQISCASNNCEPCRKVVITYDVNKCPAN